jgi:tRNA A-37 threonylcarbamoyl transferase component Bud32
MPSSGERPPLGSGNLRLGIGLLAISPVFGGAYARAVLARRKFANDTSARRALDDLGLHAPGPLSVRMLGTGKSNAVIAVDAADGTRIVLKRALAFGSVMAWGARHFGANYVYAPEVAGSARITREAAALRFLDAHGILVPRCLAAAPDRGLLALAWVDGTPAAVALRRTPGETLAKEIGALFRRVHELGVTLADGHPGNMLVEDGTGRLVIFDLEFAETSGSTPARRGFDLAYAAVLMPTEAQRAAMLDAYGPRTVDEAEALVTAEQHLRKFGRLLEMERARWDRAAAS